MHIVHIVIGKANPNRMNGVSKIAHSMADTAARETKNTVELIGIGRNAYKTEEHAFERSYKRHLIKADPRLPFSNGDLMKKLKPIMEAWLKQDTVVHFHGGLIPIFGSVARLLKKHNIPWTITTHGGYMPRVIKRRYWLKFPFIHLCDKVTVGDCNLFHGHTTDELENVQSFYPSVQGVLTPNGQNYDEIDDYFERNKAVKKAEAFCTSIGAHAVDPGPVYVFVGRLEPYQKGLDLMINAFAQHKNSGGMGTLWIVGNSPQRGYLENLAHSQTDPKHIQFFGARFNDEKYHLLHAADIFIHTSRFEGMPTAVIEGAAFGNPLFLTPGTTMIEWVEKYNSGWTTTDDTVEAIIKGLTEIDTTLKNSPDALKKRARNSVDMARNNFTWSDVVDNIIQLIYKPILKQ